MSESATTADARVGDWIEERAIEGAPMRRGQIVEVLGHPGHRHFRVRWDEDHESIHFPGPYAHVVRGHAASAHARRP